MMKRPSLVFVEEGPELLRRSLGCLALAVGVWFASGACSEQELGADGSAGDATDAGARGLSQRQTEARRRLLGSLSARVIAPSYASFAGLSQGLEEALQDYSVALAEGAEAAETERAAAQAAWREAMAAWQRVELLQLGPAGAVDKVVGGQSSRDEIYSWPTTNPCAVDQKVSRAEYETEGFIDQSLVNVYGLDALEYLLFDSDLENACPVSLTINRDGEWQALSEATIRVRRGAYGLVVAAAVAEQAQALAAQWAAGSENFRASLSDFESEGRLFEDAAAAIDALFRAIFYLDAQSKDKKLASPLGLLGDCTAETCLDRLESRWAQHSKQNLLANLEVVRDLFRGHQEDEEAADAFGLAALLRDEGHEALADGMSDAIQAAVAATATSEGSLRELIARDPEGARTLYDKVKRFTDQLKGAMVMALSLSIPLEASGDND